MTEMNEVDLHGRRCKICIKAFQNVQAALFYMTKLEDLHAGGEKPLLSSIFLSAVIRYARPFTESRTKRGDKVKFGVKPLKAVDGFDLGMHHHLLHVRDRLLAHDDLAEIQPALVASCVFVPRMKKSIPVRINMANKCLGYPSERNTVAKMKAHISAALFGISAETDKALVAYRTATIENPNMGNVQTETTEKLGAFAPGDAWYHFKPPSLAGHAQLEIQVPDYSHVHDGYQYEELSVERHFRGPEKINLGEGIVLEFWPGKPPAATEGSSEEADK